MPSLTWASLPRVRQPLVNRPCSPAPLALRAVNRGGKVRVGISQMDATKEYMNGSASWVVSRFQNKYDLIAALASSCYLPWWAQGRGG